MKTETKVLSFPEVMREVSKTIPLAPTLPPKGKPALFVKASIKSNLGWHFTKVVRFDGRHIYLNDLLSGVSSFVLPLYPDLSYHSKFSITRLPQRIRNFIRDHKDYQAWLRGEAVEKTHPSPKIENMERLEDEN